MNTKMINNIPVSDEIFNKMVLLQERTRRIEAEIKVLMFEKNETEREVKEVMAQIEVSAPKQVSENPLVEQVAAVTSPAVA